MGKRSCKSHVLAVANLAADSCKNVTVGCFSKCRGGTLSVPVNKTRMSSTLQFVFSSAKERINLRYYGSTYPCNLFLFIFFFAKVDVK